ncbi:hypothetical protein [Arthrobacter gengyunqii]|uniref:Uncharacterized protein n=1 Tax=Arthrobacter gengyunqii TaxID=2886940 RepID=A0ABS8GDP6_9MICC|nr:hypothetical protein [Arthrobacter gengyunqii]MCC3264739.1 hypothetical protein [Arthrobacter gengyunqii]
MNLDENPQRARRNCAGILLAGAADRLVSSDDRRMFMAWLSGRGPLDPKTELAPW